MTTPLQAARLGDQIGHTAAMSWLVRGLVAGFIASVAVVAIVGTGGIAAVAIGAVIAGTAAGGIKGMNFGATRDGGPKGPIMTGSPDTFLGASRKPAARAIIDTVLCASHDIKPIAQGSIDVFINQKPAARYTDKTVCSGKIREGQVDVFFGGETGTYLEMESEVPRWLVTTLRVGVWVGAAIATGGAIIAVGFSATLIGAAASYAGGTIGSVALGWAGEALFGERGRFFGELIGAQGGTIAGGYGARLYTGARGVPNARRDLPTDFSTAAPPPVIATPSGRPDL